MVEDGGIDVGGAVCTLFGGGGVNGTLLGGIVVEDAGVAGVGALSGALLTAPRGGGTFAGAAGLCDPGRKAGSEEPFDTSAKGR